MTWADIITRLRRFLRDPDGQIWSDADLLANFNDAQHEIANKTGSIIQVNACYYPPEFTYSYLYDWEREHLEGDRLQVLTVGQPRNLSHCYPWEVAWWLDTEPTDDSGYRWTHPVESGYGSPADIVPIPLHEQFRSMRMAVWDGEPITPISEYELVRRDHNYRLTAGDTQNYYHLDGDSNLIVPYPRPSITWYETGVDDIYDDAGGIVAVDESYLDGGDTGLTTDVIPVDGTFFFVFEAWPSPLVEATDIPDFAPFLTKYVEAATLERCYSADTDGFIPSLRDFWKSRKDVGIQAIKKWQRLGLTNRQYRLGGIMKRAYTGKYPRLPATYDDRY